MVSAAQIIVRHPLYHVHRLPFTALILILYSLLSLVLYILISIVLIRFQRSCGFTQRPFMVLIMAKIPGDMILTVLAILQIYVETVYYHHIQLPQYRPSFKIFTCLVEVAEHLTLLQTLSLIFCAFTAFTHEHLVQIWSTNTIVLLTIIQTAVAFFLNVPRLIKLCYYSTPDVFIVQLTKIEDSQTKDMLESAGFLALCGFVSMMTLYSKEKNREILIFDDDQRHNVKDFRVLIVLVVCYIMHVARQFISDSTRDTIISIHTFSAFLRSYTLLIFATVTPWALTIFHRTIRQRLFDLKCSKKDYVIRTLIIPEIFLESADEDESFSITNSRSESPVAL